MRRQRAQRKSDREAGLIEAGPPIQANDPLDDDLPIPSADESEEEDAPTR